MGSQVSLPLWVVVVMAILAILAALDRILIPSVRWALRRRAKWRRVLIFVLLACGILEVLFFGSNLAKIAHGGWLPLLLAFVIFVMLTTW